MVEESIESNDNSISEAQEAVEQITTHAIERRLPRVNCQEHIVLVVDVSQEEGFTPFKLSEGSKFSPFQMLKRALSLFLHNKHSINPEHKFALVILQEIPIWITGFTSNPEDIIGEIEDLTDSPPSSQCDLTLLFDLIKSQVTLPEVSSTIAPPPYVVRTIILYGRSHCLPQFLGSKSSYDSLTEAPHFFLDILYMHEVPSDDNKSEGIYDLLLKLDEGSWSYIFEVSRNATKLHNYFGSLLAHPLQRPAQADTSYILDVQ